MAHKSHRKHHKHVRQHAITAYEHVEPESLRALAGELVHRAVETVKAAPNAIARRVMRRPRALIEKLSGTYASIRSK